MKPATMTHPLHPYLLARSNGSFRGRPQAGNLGLEPTQLCEKLSSLHLHSVQTLGKVQNVILQHYQQILLGKIQNNCICALM